MYEISQRERKNNDGTTSYSYGIEGAGINKVIEASDPQFLGTQFKDLGIKITSNDVESIPFCSWVKTQKGSIIDYPVNKDAIKEFMKGYNLSDE